MIEKITTTIKVDWINAWVCTIQFKTKQINDIEILFESEDLNNLLRNNGSHCHVIK
jgi:hypothetical protein